MLKVLIVALRGTVITAFVTCIPAFIASSPAKPATAPVPITVGKSIQASIANARVFHGEVVLAADPHNANHLIACSMFGLNGDATSTPRTVIAYVSFDRGKTWTPTIKMPGLMGEPACALGPNNDAYLGALSGPYMTDEGVMHGPWAYVYRSADGGRTWEKSLQYASKLGEFDREYFDVDATGGRYNGRVYFHLFDGAISPTKFSGVPIVLRSDDRGKTFLPAVIADPKAEGMQVGPAAITADGTLLWEQARINTNRMVVSVSRDGGQIFHTYTVISNPGDGGIGLDPIAADASNGPYRNRAYVVWIAKVGPQMHVWLSHSDDYGKTWSVPAVVDDNPDDANGTWSLKRAVVAVNREGIVGVLWLDSRGISDGYGFNVRFAASDDGGVTFSHSVRVSAAPNLLEPGSTSYLDDQTYGGGKARDNYPPGFLNQYHHGVPLIGAVGPNTRFVVTSGDVIGLVADAGGEFHAAWIGNSTGIGQIWTTPIGVAGSAIRNGDPSLQALSDVTGRVKLILRRPVFNRLEGTLTVQAAVVNASREPMRGPIAMRLTAMRSRIGVLHVVDADNGQTGPGAIWRLQVPGGTLRPGASTKLRSLTFHFDRFVHPINSGNLNDYLAVPLPNYLTIEAHAFAR